MSSVSSRPPDPRSRSDREVLTSQEYFVDLNSEPPTLSEDLVDWVDEMVSAGLERRVAHRLTLIAVVVVALREMPSFLGPASEHISVALMDPDTFDAVQATLVEPDLDEAWETLAQATEGPVSARCAVLARLCRRNGLRVVTS